MVINRIYTARDLEKLRRLVVELNAVFVETLFNPVQLIFHACTVVGFELSSCAAGGQKRGNTGDCCGKPAESTGRGHHFGNRVHTSPLGVCAKAVAVPRTDAASESQSGALVWSTIPYTVKMGTSAVIIP